MIKKLLKVKHSSILACLIFIDMIGSIVIGSWHFAFLAAVLYVVYLFVRIDEDLKEREFEND